MREIVIDTETTGLSAADGHRIIEMAAVELDGIVTGARWHSYFDPEGRKIDPGATAIHGLTAASLQGSPRFAEMVEDFLAFVGDAPLIAHNAQFDRGFIAAEMARCGRSGWSAQWIDTLPMSKKKIPRKRHTLDALCLHFGISKSARPVHGAVLDTLLLAEVYIRLTGRLDQLEMDALGKERVYLRGREMLLIAPCEVPHPGPRPRALKPRITAKEEETHYRFITGGMQDPMQGHAADGKFAQTVLTEAMMAAIAAFNDGMEVEEACARFNINRGTFYWWRKRLGTQKRPHPGPSEKTKAAIEAYQNSKEKIDSICARFGINRTTLYEGIDRLEIPRRGRRKEPNPNVKTAIEFYKKGGIEVADISKRFNVPHSVLYYWIERLEVRKRKRFRCKAGHPAKAPFVYECDWCGDPLSDYQIRNRRKYCCAECRREGKEAAKLDRVIRKCAAPGCEAEVPDPDMPYCCWDCFKKDMEARF